MDGDPSNQQNQQPNSAYDAWSSMANEASGEQISKDSENLTRIDDVIQRDVAAGIGTKAINFNLASAPEGVRDEQDYREYQAEHEAKLSEAKAFFDQNFRSEDFVNNQELDEFLNSPELKIVTDAGFSMQDLRAAGLISTPDQKPRVNLSDYAEDIRSYMWNCSAGDLFNGYLGAKDVIEDLSNLFNDNYWVEEAMDDVRVMREDFKAALEKRKNGENLTNDDYSRIIEEPFFFGPLGNRIIYGNPFDPKDRVEKTVSALTEYQGGDNEKTTWFRAEVARKIDDGNFDNSSRTIATTLATVCQRDADAHIEYLQRISEYNDEEVSEAQALLMRTLDDSQICKYHDALVESGIREANMLDTMYCSGAPYGKPFAKHLYPSWDLAEHSERLKKNGFSTDSIVDAIRDNNININLYRVEKMREAGISDADIIYAGELYRVGEVQDNGTLKVTERAFERSRYSQFLKGDDWTYFEPKDVITALQRELKNRN